MLDIGDIVGSLMSGLIQARRVADEQTASLAEYYLSNPLLEGLSVPRIRIPELTIDMPILIGDYHEAIAGKMADHNEIIAAALEQINSNMRQHNIKVEAMFHHDFEEEAKKRLDEISKSSLPIMKESVLRGILSAVDNALGTSKTILVNSVRELLTIGLRNKVSSMCIAKPHTYSKVEPNVKTADVKEQGTPTSVVRLKITLREEGLEWMKETNKSGDTVRSLQPE